MQFSEPAKFKVGNRFSFIKGESQHWYKGEVIKIVEIVPPGSKPTCYCHHGYFHPVNQFSYVVTQGEWYVQTLESTLLNKCKKANKEWEDHYISHSAISTAIFEYLEKRGFKPNRKKGIRSGSRNGDLIVRVEKKCIK